jgi:hypothetical protein
MPVMVGYVIFRLTSRPEPELVVEPRQIKVDVGDRIVYTKTKISPLPGARAYQISASDKGENYTYLVDKYWVVADVLDDGCVVAYTRRGKVNYISPDDPHVRKAGLVDSLVRRNRFPSLALAA